MLQYFCEKKNEDIKILEKNKKTLLVFPKEEKGAA